MTVMTGFRKKDVLSVASNVADYVLLLYEFVINFCKILSRRCSLHATLEMINFRRRPHSRRLRTDGAKFAVVILATF